MADNLRHPALRFVMAHRASAYVPQALLLCGTPRVLDAVEELRLARSRVVAGRR
jgi:hypothetical protein